MTSGWVTADGETAWGAALLCRSVRVYTTPDRRSVSGAVPCRSVTVQCWPTDAVCVVTGQSVWTVESSPILPAPPFYTQLSALNGPPRGEHLQDYPSMTYNLHQPLHWRKHFARSCNLLQDMTHNVRLQNWRGCMRPEGKWQRALCSCCYGVCHSVVNLS